MRTSPRRADVVQMIRRHLAAEFNRRASAIDEWTDIRSEIPVESVDVYTLEQAIKERFGVDVSFRADQVATVGDVADVVMRRVDADA